MVWQVFGLAVLDNAVSLGAIIFAVHLPNATGQAGRKGAGSSVSTVANDNSSM